MQAVETRARSRSTIEMAAAAVGATFLLVGALGFIPGITTNVEDMTFAGHDSGAKLLGIFQVSVLHNLVHLAFGVVGLVAARTVAASKAFLIWGGVLYLGLWLYGLLVGDATSANFVPMNAADDWLHFALGAGMIALGVTLGRGTAARR